MKFAVPLLFAVALPVAAQDGEAQQISTFGRRYDAFRSMFEAKGLRLGSLEDFNGTVFPQDADGWIVVAVGDVSKIPVPGRNWVDFVRGGGSLLVASDLGDWIHSRSFGFTFNAGPVIAPEGYECIGGARDCPLLPPGDAEHPLFKNIAPIAVNRGGYLTRNNLRVVPSVTVRYPHGSSLPDGNVLNNSFAMAAKSVGNGRVLLAADHSIFINEMMLDATGVPINALFAVNAVDWLVGDRDVNRIRVLFLEDGVPITDWIDPRFESGEWPTSPFGDKLLALDKLLRAMNKMVLEQQARRDPNTGRTLYNQAVRNWELRFPEHHFLRWAIVGLMLLLLLMLLRWLWLARASSPPQVQKLDDEDKAMGLLDQRRVELMEEGHFIYLARGLARYWWRRRFGSPPPAKLPMAYIENAYWSRKQWERKLREAWVLAADAEHRSMTLKDFNRFRSDLSKLDAMVIHIGHPSEATARKEDM